DHSRMHANPASRGRPCPAAFISIAAPASLAAVVRPLLLALSEALSPQSAQQALRPASSALVCAKPSGRGFCRNLRRVAHAALGVAQTLCRLAGIEEAAICRRVDGGDRGKEAAAGAAARSRPAETAQSHACSTLQEETGFVRRRFLEIL